MNLQKKPPQTPLEAIALIETISGLAGCYVGWGSNVTNNTGVFRTILDVQDEELIPDPPHVHFDTRQQRIIMFHDSGAMLYSGSKTKGSWKSMMPTLNQNHLLTHGTARGAAGFGIAECGVGRGIRF